MTYKNIDVYDLIKPEVIKLRNFGIETANLDCKKYFAFFELSISMLISLFLGNGCIIIKFFFTFFKSFKLKL